MCDERELTTKLRHSRRKPAWPAMMMFKFHVSVKTEGTAAVACSARLGHVNLSMLDKPFRYLFGPRDLQDTDRSRSCHSCAIVAYPLPTTEEKLSGEDGSTDSRAQNL